MPLPATCALAGGPVDSCVRQTLVSVRQKTDAIAGSASVSLLPVGARRVSSVAVRLVAVLASGPYSLRWGPVRSQMKGRLPTLPQAELSSEEQKSALQPLTT